MKTATDRAATAVPVRCAAASPSTFTIKPSWRTWLAQAWADAIEAWALV
jgi:hypothetical protein